MSNSPKIRNMEEFASVSGLSRPTVSKYFNDPESVRASTRARIEQALDEYDYTPNIYAMNQNRKLTKIVGILVPYLADPFFAEIARNVEQRCIDAGFRPTLYSSHGDPNLEVEILESLRSLKPAGVLMAPLGRSSIRHEIEKFCNYVPTVLFDSNIPDLGFSFVGSNNTQFSMLMAEYLCRTGEPPCFFEMQFPSNPNANKRRQGYLDAMQRLGHEPKVIKIEGDGWAFEEIGRLGAHRVFDTGGFPSSTILCSNDRLAIGVLTACWEKGVRVGIDSNAPIRVAGQDDHPLARYTCPPLTTIAQEYEAISSYAVEVLAKAVAGEKKPHESKLFEGKLIMRESA